MSIAAAARLGQKGRHLRGCRCRKNMNVKIPLAIHMPLRNVRVEIAR